MKLENKIAAGAVALLAIMAVLQLGFARLNARDAYANVRPPERPSLIVPVQGVATGDLTDTWGAARSQGRTHQGIDILAPARTPVLAAQGGTIARFFNSERGGITIYEYDQTGKFVLYYAHLSAHEASLREGDSVRQGQVIGYVGQTGNATTPHLHFEIQRLGPEHKWYRAEAMNPYPLLLDEHMPPDQ